MVPGVVGSSPIIHPILWLRAGASAPALGSLLPGFSILGCSQAVRHGTLTPAFVGSSPTIPARSAEPSRAARMDRSEGERGRAGPSPQVRVGGKPRAASRRSVTGNRNLRSKSVLCPSRSESDPSMRPTRSVTTSEWEQKRGRAREGRAIPASPSRREAARREQAKRDRFAPDLKTSYDPVAQLVEQRPFKAKVRGSSPRWVTTSLRTTYRSQRLFLQKSLLTHSVAAPFQIEPASLGFDLVLASPLAYGIYSVGLSHNRTLILIQCVSRLVSGFFAKVPVSKVFTILFHEIGSTAIPK